MKKLSFLILAFLFSILTKTFGQNFADVQGTWNGTASLVEKLSGEFATSERHIVLNIKDNKVTGTVSYSGDVIVNGKKLGHDECSGGGSGELISVNIRTWDSTYDINIEGPECKLIAGGGNSGDGLTGIGISDQKLQLINGQLNTVVLSGTETTTRNVVNMGTFTRTITWHLVASLDVELIVTPVGYDITGTQKSYDDWLPEPGKDETNKGSYMKIKLKLQSKSGKPLKYNAQSFELKLSNTSIEPGITINYPLNPQPNQLPDLRFIPLPVAESDDQDQYITVSCLNGTTGETFIASYDGGGATTLTVEATLVGGIHIKGQLLISGGDEEIQIPKRKPGTMIATAWLTRNGNPGEMDDKENSANNNFKGDGLTAYEEYRGVISQEKFKRLNPKKKEVGILATKKDFSLFDGGITWFKDASDLEPIRFDFDKDETAPTGQINFNKKSNHDFDQYAIYLMNGGLGSNNGTLGATYCNSALWIPPNIKGVVIDWNKIQASYTRLTSNAQPDILKFTVKEYLAQTVAHELGHAVNIDHHGGEANYGPWRVADISEANRIFDRNGNLITIRPYDLIAIGDSTGTVESGDMLCMLNYYPYFQWGYSRGADGANIFNQEPLLPLGRTFCTSPNGTGINATKLYFGKAAIGNCLGHIQLRN